VSYERLNFSSSCLNTSSTDWSALTSNIFQVFLYSVTRGKAFSTYKSILFSIAVSLSSDLFSSLSHVSGSITVPALKVSDVFGLYILHNNLSLAFCSDS
jgi:hypothetical protein